MKLNRVCVILIAFSISAIASGLTDNSARRISRSEAGLGHRDGSHRAARLLPERPRAAARRRSWIRSADDGAIRLSRHRFSSGKGERTTHACTHAMHTHARARARARTRVAKTEERRLGTDPTGRRESLAAPIAEPRAACHASLAHSRRDVSHRVASATANPRPPYTAARID